MRQADRVTERQNDSMTVWQNSRAAKEPALVNSHSHGPKIPFPRVLTRNFRSISDHLPLVPGLFEIFGGHQGHIGALKSQGARL